MLGDLGLLGAREPGEVNPRRQLSHRRQGPVQANPCLVPQRDQLAMVFGTSCDQVGGPKGFHWWQLTHHLVELCEPSSQCQEAAASGANFPCFRAGIPTKKITSQLRDRFKLYKSKRKLHRWVVRTIDYSYDNFWTMSFGKFQLLTNGIVP